ncbi:DUF4269 domain-containing protein [Paenibacillus ginsengarvi]|uniref:DUF4269 domain-containing protein n=1 Tax=Paenibacillus ginsengarvi TaxID=400777 RepID=A0A3B0CLM4_9BACL|nr:DUF4269 domain-containing protein [Paenibacillus ginsengarvi]RKN86575.1 DUF4269 domain-containing protein [Paenibacillus ginsengarvi]
MREDVQRRSWSDIEYLRVGTAVQRKAYDVIFRFGLLEPLRPYQPVVVGTIPIELNVQGSDLDIACEVYRFEPFEQTVRKAFGGFDQFEFVRRGAQRGRKERAVVRFECGNLPVELFAEPAPVRMQNGYRHMVIEARLLELYGQRAKEAILNRKRAGMKTEPAFADYFGLKGDPYEALLELELYSDEQLSMAVTPVMPEQTEE